MGAPARLQAAWATLLAALLLAFALAAPAGAQSFPKFTGLVTDAAGVLPAEQRAALETKLEALQQQTNHQLVVATIPDLQGYDIADYGYRLGRAWGVGLKGADNGAILIVAPKDRKVRIEVGYGLEGSVTDAFSSVLIRQDILPRFKAGDIPGGIQAGVDALSRQLSLPDDQAKAKAAEAAKEFNNTHRRAKDADGFPLGLVFWLVLVAAFLGLRWASRRGGQTAYRGGATLGGGGGSNWPIWLWAGSELLDHRRERGDVGGGLFGGGDGGGGGGSDGSWGGGGFTGGGGGSFGGGGASGGW